MELLAVFVITALLLSSAGLAAWVAGAIYYDMGQSTRWASWLSWGWVALVVGMFVSWRPTWQPFVAVVGVWTAVRLWWFRQKPSHDRDWEPSVAVLPRAVRNGDVVTIENVRNFEYRSLSDYTPKYETRTYHLSNLKGADVIFFNWGVELMSHPALTFDFGPDGRLCISVEVRYRKGQKYSLVRSIYRQQELIFVAADERDEILLRTKHSQNQVAHLYRMNVGVEEMRATFLDYVQAINDLYATPRWYHGLCTNCTTSFYKLPHSRTRFDWRVILNGRLDRALYQDGRIDRSLPFRELERLAYLNDIANSAPEAGFSDHIRRELERRRHER